MHIRQSLCLFIQKAKIFVLYIHCDICQAYVIKNSLNTCLKEEIFYYYSWCVGIGSYRSHWCWDHSRVRFPISRSKIASVIHIWEKISHPFLSDTDCKSLMLWFQWKKVGQTLCHWAVSGVQYRYMYKQAYLPPHKQY